VTTWQERPPKEPQLQLVATLFRVAGASRRPLRCAVLTGSRPAAKRGPSLMNCSNKRR